MGQALAHQFVGIGMGDVLAAEGNTAAAGMHQTGNGLQNGGLTGAVGTDQSYDLAFADFEGNTLDGMNGAVVNVHIFNFQHQASLSSLPR